MPADRPLKIKSHSAMLVEIGNEAKKVKGVLLAGDRLVTFFGDCHGKVTC